jgi:hypothetical protein
LEELGDVDWLGISPGDYDGKVWAWYTTIISLGTIDWSLYFHTDIESFCSQPLPLSDVLEKLTSSDEIDLVLRISSDR